MKYCIATFCGRGGVEMCAKAEDPVNLALELCGDNISHTKDTDEDGDEYEIFIRRFDTETERRAYVSCLEDVCCPEQFDYTVWEEGGLENIQYDAWALSADDLTDRYDCSQLSDEEINRILVKIHETMIKNDAMAECFWYCIDYIAELKGLERID